MLIEIILALVEKDETQMRDLLHDLDSLVPVYSFDDGMSCARFIGPGKN